MLHKLKGVFKLFEENDVRYLIIGGIAAALHGVPRNTFDMDIIIEATARIGLRLNLTSHKTWHSKIQFQDSEDLNLVRKRI